MNYVCLVRRPSNILLKSTLVVEANASSSIVAPMRPRLTIAAPVRSTLLPVVAKIGDFGLSILLPASARAHGSKKLLENIGQLSLVGRDD